ncbi:hypothetical protein F5884DRAFT_826498 [Xylogone sp. PMI_703]|nr:hypothetical protein F5884DRAFT_826498 [Xylogone sp. PMI_703]
MPCPTVDLEPYKELIVEQYNSDFSVNDSRSSSSMGVYFREVVLPDRDMVSMGLYRKGLNSATERQQLEEKIKEIMASNHGTACSLGIGMLYTHLNSLGDGHYGRDRIAAAIRAVDPESVQRRYKEMKETRGEFIVPGPNFVWSVDGYCKLRFVGIEIYAGIDVYSRFVPWVYVGISNKTAISVLRQFLDLVNSLDIHPLHIRSDRGVETPMMADAHYILHEAVAIASGRALYEFSEVFWFRTSTVNQHIEAWEEVLEVVRLWNIHKIRKQPHRLYLVSGKPWMLYFYPGDDIRNYGITPDHVKLAQIREVYADWDIDVYLPQTTKE